MNVEFQKSNSNEPNKSKSQSSRSVNLGGMHMGQNPSDLNQSLGIRSPLFSLIIIIGGSAIADVIAMIVLYPVRLFPYYLLILLDVVIMTLIISPLIYFLSIRPLLRQNRQQQQSDKILQSRLELMEFANSHTLEELLQMTLDEVEFLTGSTISFFHFLEADQKTIYLQAWSTNTMQNMCNAEGKDRHYDLEKAGVWADAIRKRKPIIHNNYATLTDRKGLPEGHAQVIREMVIPILRDKKVLAILGIGNKSQDFTTNDMEVVTTFADFAWDIVEHKRSENAIRMSEEKFRTLVDWTSNWEQWMDPQSNLVYISPSCVSMSGYTPEEFKADPNLLIRIVHPEDRNMYEEHQTINHDASVGPLTINYRIISRDGSEHWIEHNCRSLFGSENQYLGRRISNRETTDRIRAEEALRKSEEQYRSLVLATTQIVWETNAEGEVRGDIPMWRSYTGQSIQEIQDQGWINALHPDDQERVSKIWANALQTIKVYDTEYRIRSKSGEYGEFSVRGVPITDKDGNVISWVGTCTDITEKKNYEKQLIQAEKHAVIGRMVGSVTHEINNPLQTIKNCLYLIQQDIDPDSNNKEPLEMALSEAQRLSSLVGQLRQLYRPRSEQTMYKQDLMEIIDEVHSLIRPYLSHSHVVWKLLPDIKHYSIICVRDQIIEVFLNVCMNAIEAMQPAGGTLSVNIFHTSGKEQVGIEISDSGPGVVPELLPHIFEPFITTKEYGLGLGLSICYGIIEKHGGQITVESQPGQGTSFTIWLPIISREYNTRGD
jgi:two-component system cell cycle sensor histidine kinase/response regulator CckA